MFPLPSPAFPCPGEGGGGARVNTHVFGKAVECINVVMFVGKCTNCGTSDMCGVCNDQRCTSDDRPTTRTCTNCGVQSSGSICTRCHSLPRCVACHRYLPPACFPPDSLLCQACYNKQEKPYVRATERNIVTEVTFPTARATQSFDSFLSHNNGVINNIIDDYRRQYRSIRVHFRADAIFVRQTEDDQQQRIPAYFSTPVYDVDDTQNICLDTVAADLSGQVEHWNARGSGFVLDRITKFVGVISQYRPLQGSSWLETPQWLAKKQAIVNVKNTTDSKCFVWAVLSCIHPAPHHPYRVSNYTHHQNSLNLSGLTFPMPVRDIPKFEKQNPTISINVLCKGDDDGYVPLYVSKERDRRHHVNLFLIEGPHNSIHYVWIKNMSRLVAGRTTSTNQTYVCNSCLHPFRRKHTLDSHIPNCQRHPPQDVRYPDPKNPKSAL